ncbi:MAG: hypothetical protein C3F17_15790 [Bradyrhizobiaceae bacterium]|nr:MAG: hypothetical protein C3F17_15790 [Bradyrhizobiaceae bacterium]
MKPGGPYLPPRIPTPKERAERRKRILSVALWSAAALPLIFVVMAYGYSDQAPAALRDFTMRLDQSLGSPVWEILRRFATR